MLKLEISELAPGTIIKSSRWNEPVKIDKASELGDYVSIIGSTINSSNYINDLVPTDEIKDFSIQKIEIDFSGDPNEVFLSFETKRYRYASIYDPLLAVNTSKVDPLPHQIEAVYGYILKLPRIRFLIADDPGAGKTIMAGLIIKELKLRNLIKNVLIVVPGHLKDQWRRELKERFEENFVVVDRGFMDSHHGENVWEKETNIITSIDFAKRDDIMPSLSSSYFDLVIVDEAHKMSAYKYGDSAPKKTTRYKLGELLSKNSNHLLFLTATPHKGDPENFKLFLDLLEPGFFSDPGMIEESIENKDNPLFIRRVKEDLKNFKSEPLFLPRTIYTPKFKLSPNEKKLYNEVSKYVEKQYNKALAKSKKRNIAFALVILQRRMASSTYALYKSLERRRDKLETLEKMSERALKTKVKTFDFEDVEDMSEESRWEEEEIWETLSVAENKEELKREIQTLKKLIKKAEEVLQTEEEVKLNQLKDTLIDLNNKYPNQRVIIFTESRDTLEYLEKKVQYWGYSVNTIHGGMKLEQRIEAESIFKNETQVLIATEAAGEGINLQFCNLMINYDIPWNPNRLEQRMGRIHRYGQNKEVFIYNLVAEDTREGEVLVRIFEKLEEIKKNLGSDKVFDVIGEVFFGRNLQQILMETAAGARGREEILQEIDITVDEAYIKRVKEDLGESLATKHIDYTRIKEMADKAREYKLIPEYTESFFKKAFSLAGGKYRYRKDEFMAIDSIPYEIKLIAGEDKFKRNYGVLTKKYPKITFDKDKAFKNSDAELLSFGHPLFEAVLEYVERKYSESLKRGAVFVDPEGKLDGYIVFYEGEIKDGTKEPNNIAGKRFFAIYKSEDETRPIPPSILWDLVKGNGKEEIVSSKQMESEVIRSVISQMEDYKKEKQAERDRESHIKQKYGIKSLEEMILKLDGDIINYQKRKERGDNVDLIMGNKIREKNKYLKSLDELKDQIEREKMLTMGMPKFVGVIRVKAAKDVHESMRSSEEIEKIGMDESIKYEINQGRHPEDVSAENLGFDIRSTGSNGKIRYIEVKARAGIGDIVLTQNEMFKAKRFGNNYYLYVVFNAASDPDLLIIQNPAKNLNAEKRPEIVRYYIKSIQIEEKGIKNG